MMSLSRLWVFMSIIVIAFLILARCSVKSIQNSDFEYKILGPSNKLLETGDPKAGLNYLLYGDYIGSGLPYDLFANQFGSNKGMELKRTGKNEFLNYGINTFTTDQGVQVIAGLNCFACHASTFEDEFVIGLGNIDIEMNGFTTVSLASQLLQSMVEKKYGEESHEAVLSHQFLRGFNAVAPHIETPFRGVNPAFRIEETAAAHRDPIDLSWKEDVVFEYLPYTIASDIPPWWHVKKKNGLYYNGMGRGAFSKMIEQISVVAIKDSTQARQIHNNFDDVLAYIQNIKPPKYPHKIDDRLALIGQSIFIEHCETCHGTYGEMEKFPNKLIPIDEVKTDPYYAQMLSESEITKWYNKSWYATSYPQSSMHPGLVYIAPPLDGIWCTAPYLHNGSIPNLHTLLKSKDRPQQWIKDNANSYDYQNVGWIYRESDFEGKERGLYNTFIKGYSNQGHTYGDKLSKRERLALIEYLKTL